MRVVILLFFGWLLLGAIVWFFRGKLLFHPEGGGVIGATSAVSEEVFFRAEDGVRLHGVLLKGCSGRGVVLFCHGNGGNVAAWLPAAEDIRSLGWSVFLFDYRGYGHSEGTPTETGILADGEAAWEELRRRGYAPKDIVVVGRSLGGAVAAHVAQKGQAGGLVLESAFSSLGEIGQDLYPFLPIRLFLGDTLGTASDLARFGGAVLVFHGTDDELVRFEHGQRLYRAAASSSSARLIPLTGGHNDAYSASADTYLCELGAFLEELRGSVDSGE